MEILRFFAHFPDSHNSKSRWCDLHVHGPASGSKFEDSQIDQTSWSSSSKHGNCWNRGMEISTDQRFTVIFVDFSPSTRSVTLQGYCQSLCNFSHFSTATLPLLEAWKHGRIRASDRRSIESCYSFAKQTAPRSPPVPGCSTLAVACQ